jgi:hypothetical protein
MLRLPVLFAAAALAVLPAAAMAQTYGNVYPRPAPGFAPAGQDLIQRDQNQRERIEDGARSGRLTRGEVRDLRYRQGQIRNMIQSARANGFVNPREHVRISRELDDQDRRIARNMRDRDRRFPARY